MTERHLVGKTSEFTSPDDRIIVEIRGSEIAVFQLDGEYHAIANFCPHQSAPLCEGEITGKIVADEETGWDWQYEPTQKHIVCPWHGWVFDVTSGKSIDTDRYRTPTYEVEVEEGDIYVIR